MTKSNLKFKKGDRVHILSNAVINHGKTEVQTKGKIGIILDVGEDLAMGYEVKIDRDKRSYWFFSNDDLELKQLATLNDPKFLKACSKLNRAWLEDMLEDHPFEEHGYLVDTYIEDITKGTSNIASNVKSPTHKEDVKFVNDVRNYLLDLYNQGDLN